MTGYLIIKIIQVGIHLIAGIIIIREQEKELENYKKI